MPADRQEGVAASIQDKLNADFHEQARRESGEAILHGEGTPKPTGLRFPVVSLKQGCAYLPIRRRRWFVIHWWTKADRA